VDVSIVLDRDGLARGSRFVDRGCPLMPGRVFPRCSLGACTELLPRVQFMHDRVTAAARDQRAVDGHGEHERDDEAEREAPPEACIG
jgi:hypothetical protein